MVQLTEHVLSSRAKAPASIHRTGNHRGCSGSIPWPRTRARLAVWISQRIMAQLSMVVSVGGHCMSACACGVLTLVPVTTPEMGAPAEINAGFKWLRVL
jgi:hypothetical protein